MHNFFLIFCNNLRTLLDSFKVSEVYNFSDQDSDYDANEAEYSYIEEFYLYKLIYFQKIYYFLKYIKSKSS